MSEVVKKRTKVTKDYDYYLKRVRSDFLNFEKVPVKFKTKEMCWEAVNQHGHCIDDVPLEHMSEELCLLAIERHGNAIVFMPEVFKTKKVCEAAILGPHPWGHHCIEHVPDQFKTQEICLAAVKAGGSFFHVPQEFLNEEIILISINNGCNLSLNQIPDHLISDAVIEAVVEKGDATLEDIPYCWQDPKLVELGVKRFGYSIQYVDPDLITQELVEIAVKQSGYNLQYVPAHLQTEEVIDAALKQDPSAKQFIKIQEMFRDALGGALEEALNN